MSNGLRVRCIHNDRFHFVVTQMVGIGTGYKYGFAGEYSSKPMKGREGLRVFDGSENITSHVSRWQMRG